NARIGFIAWKILPEKQDCERVVQNALQQLRLLPGVIELSIQHSCGGCEWMHFGLVPIHYVNDFDPLDLQVIGNQTAMASPPYRFEPAKSRTSATSLIPFACNAPINSSIVRVECPIVQILVTFDHSPGSFESANRYSLFQNT